MLDALLRVEMQRTVGCELVDVAGPNALDKRRSNERVGYARAPVIRPKAACDDRHIYARRSLADTYTNARIDATAKRSEHVSGAIVGAIGKYDY